MDFSVFLFFFSFMIMFVFVLWLGAVPFVLMINSQFFQFRKRDVFLWLFGFNIFYMILWIFMRVVSQEIVRVLSYYIGFVAFMFNVGVLFWILVLVLKLFCSNCFVRIMFKSWVRYVFIGLFFLMCLVGIYNFEKPIAVEEYDVFSSKLARDYRVVHIADIQFGTVDLEHMNEVMDLAVSLNPDFIAFTGDLIDFEGFEKADFDKFREVSVPIFFERGNHEFYHLPEKFLEDISDVESLELLDNKMTVWGDESEIEIVGIDYTNVDGLLESRLDEFVLNESRFSILLYHDPKSVRYAAEKGFDLMLYGHIHGGQIFPITLFVDWMYEFADGYFEVGDTVVYTTDGAGLWGPRLRLDSQNEIVLFNLRKE